MRYIKPQITTAAASAQIKGVDPTMGKGLQTAFDAQNSIQRTPVPAYESDE